MSAYREPGLTLDAPPPAPPPVKLRAYQLATLKAMSDGLRDDPPLTRQLVSLPCGAGKTVIFADLVRRRSHRGRALILVHRDELGIQTRAKLEAVGIPRDWIGVVQGPDDDVDAPVIVASVQTLSRPDRLARLVAASEAGPGPIETVVIDEAHHAAAASYVRIREALTPSLTVGVTATPGRADGLGLVPTHFDGLVYALRADELIDLGYLVPVVPRTFDLGVNLDELPEGITEYGRDYQPGALARALDEAQVGPRCIAAYETHAPGRQCIAYTVTVAAAHQLAAAFTAAGIPAEALDGTSPGDIRTAALDRFRTKETRVLCNCALFTEGLDIPETDAVLLARPTRSPVLFTQMAGRGMRPWPGKADCILLDGVGAMAEHGRLGYASILGLDGTPPPSASATGAGVGHTAKIRTGNPRDLLAWVPIDAGAWTLSAFDTSYYAVRSPRGVWSVFRRRKGTDDNGRPYWSNPECIATNQQEGYALGMVEDCVRADKMQRKLTPKAAWRQLAPSDTQLAACQKSGIPVDPRWTRGDINDRLTAFWSLPVIARIRERLR